MRQAHEEIGVSIHPESVKVSSALHRTLRLNDGRQREFHYQLVW